jgi:hypothetical protein
MSRGCGRSFQRAVASPKNVVRFRPSYDANSPTKTLNKYLMPAHDSPLRIDNMSSGTNLARSTTTTVNPRTKHYEFAGPPGAFAIILLIPTVIYTLYFTCSEQAGGCPPALDTLPLRFLSAVSDLDWWKSLWDTQATLIYLGWYAFCVFAWAVLPGDWVEGSELRTGGKLQYKINGGSSSLASCPCSVLTCHCQPFLPSSLPLVSRLGSSSASVPMLLPSFMIDGLASPLPHS